jgi:hypothetical protein
MDEKQRKKNLLKSLNKNREKHLNKVYRWKEYFLKSSLTIDIKLEENECDDTNKLTREFLTKNKIENNQAVLSWLSENGGYCDCEILANIEEKFD